MGLIQVSKPCGYVCMSLNATAHRGPGFISPHPALSPVGRGEGRGGPYVKEINAFVLGWVRVENIGQDAEVLEGIFFNGD